MYLFWHRLSDALQGIVIENTLHISEHNVFTVERDAACVSGDYSLRRRRTYTALVALYLRPPTLYARALVLLDWDGGMLPDVH